MRAAQAKLRQDRSLDDEARRALTVQAAQDSQRQCELQKSIGGVAGPLPFDRPGGRGHRTSLDVVVNQRILAYIQSSFWV